MKHSFQGFLTIITFVISTAAIANFNFEEQAVDYINASVIKQSIQNSGIDRFKDFKDQVPNLLSREHDSVKAFELLAYCVKIIPHERPNIIEEYLVMVSWDDGEKFSLIHLNKASFTPGWLKLGNDGGLANISGLLEGYRDFSEIPTGTKLFDFVKKTNFGNNEANPDIVVATVLAYSKDDSLILQLQNGVEVSERKRRFKLITNAIQESGRRQLEDIPEDKRE